MFKQHFPIILASNSPRRKAFLSSLGLDFTVVPATIDETPFPDEGPEQFSCRMAKTKAQAIAQTHPQCCVIAADTVVTIDNNILGKPQSPEQALSFLQKLRGKMHKVITGVSLIHPTNELLFSTCTQVWFAEYPDEILQSYVQSGDPMDKAGAYGIQSFGGFLIQSIKGSYSNVVGLPVTELVSRLTDDSIITPADQQTPC